MTVKRVAREVLDVSVLQWWSHGFTHVIKLHRTKYTHIPPQDTYVLPGATFSCPVYTKSSIKMINIHFRSIFCTMQISHSYYSFFLFFFFLFWVNLMIIFKRQPHVSTSLNQLENQRKKSKPDIQLLLFYLLHKLRLKKSNVSSLNQVKSEKEKNIQQTLPPVTPAISKNNTNIFIKFRESTTANKYMTFSKRPLRDKVHTFSVSLKCCACRLWLESHLLIQKVLQHNPGTVVRRHWQRRKRGQHV